MTTQETIEDVRDIDSNALFEYHCWESEESQDAKLWHHSHQKVKILSIADNDGMEIPTRKERDEAGQLIAYHVIFSDGFKAVVMEDELMNSEKEFYRPEPPKQQGVSVI